MLLYLSQHNLLQHPTQSWLRLSSSSNYTDAYNNTKEPLDTYIKASTILPTQLKFYLYNDEYIDDGKGNLLDPGADATGGKRSLYIKITTTTNGDAGFDVDVDDWDDVNVDIVL